MSSIVYCWCIAFSILTIILFYAWNNFNTQLNIIQTWKTHNLSPIHRNMVDKIQRLNPNSNYIFFDDNAITEFIKESYPQYLDVFNGFRYVIQKIDFFRYLAVYHYGGVYLDLDIELNMSVESLKMDHCAVFPIEYEKVPLSQQLPGLTNKSQVGLGNYAFYAPKKHPFIKHIIDSIVESMRSNMSKRQNKESYNHYVYRTTGPMQVSKAYYDYDLKNRKEVRLIKPTPFFKRAHFGNFGKHMEHGSWKIKN